MCSSVALLFLNILGATATATALFYHKTSPKRQFRRRFQVKFMVYTHGKFNDGHTVFEKCWYRAIHLCYWHMRQVFSVITQ